jgi:hypothetical protein
MSVRTVAGSTNLDERNRSHYAHGGLMKLHHHLVVFIADFI